MKFDLLNSTQPVIVTNSYIRLYCPSTTSLNISSIHIYEITQTWDENLATWSNQPFTETTPLLAYVEKSSDLNTWQSTQSIDQEHMFYRFYLNSAGNQMISDWIINPVQNYGLMFKIDITSSSTHFFSKETGGIYPQRKPYLTFDYTVANESVPEPLSMVLFSLCLPFILKKIKHLVTNIFYKYYFR